MAPGLGSLYRLDEVDLGRRELDAQRVDDDQRLLPWE
jgi:hypothetical protein